MYKLILMQVLLLDSRGLFKLGFIFLLGSKLTPEKKKESSSVFNEVLDN